ncbi:argininosuccinate synthase [Schaalia cardiffensis F0333]|uniref:Argininosuccinate synthase n=1 Tax=Schaalia cardiffensis F0333 TaxID=888050 RepID=N6WDJ7_9ACTO|nr:argininosuccinate synthase [Schaalia cardiffensis F0333]
MWSVPLAGVQKCHPRSEEAPSQAEEAGSQIENNRAARVLRKTPSLLV